MKDIKKNFLLNIAYQILILILPLITIPYISRTIGPSGIGEYSYTYSIVYYFIIFAMLGLNNYGNRSIAKCRDNIQILSKTFREIHGLQLLTTIIMIVFYIIYILFFNQQYVDVAFFQIIYLISCLFDINWFFFGLEKFKLTVTRNTVIKVLSLILIFLFVKKPEDVSIYTLILGSSTLFSNLLIWPFVKRYTVKVKIEFNDIFKHLKPCLKLFLPVIAVTMYKVMDKTMIGFFSSIDEVGFYENAEKIINVPNLIIAALGTVMLPRMSNFYGNGKNDEAKELIDKSVKLMMFLAFPMVCGLIAISKDFSIIFFGEGFVKTGYIIILLACTILFFSWGNVIRTQYLIPKEMDKDYIISAFLGAIINVVLNIIFIPKFASIGACVGTILAEFAVMFYQTYAVRKYLPLKKYINDVIPFFLKSIIMFIIILLMRNLNIVPYVRICLQVTVGIFMYVLLNIDYVFKLLNMNFSKK